MSIVTVIITKEYRDKKYYEGGIPINNNTGSYVPYLGAIKDVDLGIHVIKSKAFITNNGMIDDFVKGDGTLDNKIKGGIW